MSNVEKKRIPDAPVPIPVPGNLLSNIAPPSQLPNFVTAAPSPPTEITAPQPVVLTAQPAVLPESLEPPLQNEVFSPAIPLSKGEPVLPTRSPEDSEATQSPESLPVSTPDMDPLGDILPGSGLLTWVKGAVSTGGILHKVAEKAKNSMDSMITTLDPQMKEYLKSGGDISIVVASEKDVKISSVREAFQAVFGKATVIGCAAPSSVTADQPVGYAAAYAAAKIRIAYIRSQHAHVTNNVPIVAVEGFIQEAITDRWYELSLLVLSQPSLGIELQLQSQSTPVPYPAVTAVREATSPAHPHVSTGYAVPVGSVVADSLQVCHTQWQEACTGVSRREILLLAARSLAGSYKKLLAVSAAET